MQLIKNIITNYSNTIKSGSALPARNEIETKYKWKLEDIYTDVEKWEEDFRYVSESQNKISRFEGKLSKSAETLYECLKTDEEIGIKLGKIFLYAMLSKDLDLTDAEAQGRYDRTVNLHALISEKSSFIIPEILEIPQEKLNSFLNEKEELKIYKHFLDDILRMKPHTLDKEKEKLMAMASPVISVPYDAFSLLENADLQFPTVEGEDGKPVQLSHGRYQSALFSSNREYRQRVYKAFYKPIIEHKNTFGALFNGNIKASYFKAKARNYNSTLEAALYPNNIPVGIYENLVKSVNENLEPLQRWANLKKKILGLDELHPYDTYVTLFPASQKKYSFEEGEKIVLEALSPLGDEYINQIKFAFSNRWLDVYETPHKRSGAYSSGTTYGVHPYVLLNWNGDLNDVFTLAHEMGHCMHSYYTIENQPYPYADYTIFLAEIASTTNEALLLNYLLKNSENKEEKLFLTEKFLLNAVTTFYRQTRFAEFEKITHEKFLNGEALTPDLLCELYGNLYQKYWGNSMVTDEEETYTWARVPHFYYDFYVYQYATGFAASEALASNILKYGKVAAERYLKFLKAGSSKYSIDILKDAGVDMGSTQPILAIVQKMNNLLNEIENGI
jgi:oligoendopeptidase F